jgi:hypothetical protein
MEDDRRKRVRVGTLDDIAQGQSGQGGGDEIRGGGGAGDGEGEGAEGNICQQDNVWERLSEAVERGDTRAATAVLQAVSPTQRQALVTTATLQCVPSSAN